MADDVTRYVQQVVERELWARAAGRCQFDGCNRLLYNSPVTRESVNIAEKAHIYSFSEKGPRGPGALARKTAVVNSITNLMLMCHDCHKVIDQDKTGTRYPAALLMRWKEEHERRIATVTGVHPEKASHVILYGAKIGDQSSPLNPEAAKDALFPERYPAEEHPIVLSMKWEGNDHDIQFWRTEVENLNMAFIRQVVPVIQRAQPNHLSIFAFAPMPLLIFLGVLLTDKISADVFQLHREPEPGWKWMDGPLDADYQVNRPSAFEYPPALVISLSDSVPFGRVTAALGEEVSMWELTIGKPHNDFLSSRYQLSQFRAVVRQLLVEIGIAHGKDTPLAIFPAMPVACAVELGRVRMPKADGPWIIYDYHNKHGQFREALTIGRDHG